MLCILVVMTKTVYCRNKNVQTFKLKLYKAWRKILLLLLFKIVTSRHTMFPTDNIIDKLV